MPKLINAIPIENFCLQLEYSDGLKGEYSCARLINKEESACLANPELFRLVTIDKKSNDLIWPNGFSLCGKALYKQLQLINLMNSFHIDIEKI